jgi:hypothetical protein
MSLKIDITKLFRVLSQHLKDLKSSKFVCNTEASFESWFQVELAQTLNEMGFNEIKTFYHYAPDYSKKADLCVKTSDGEIIFEIKCFVKNQDSNKKERFPEQIKMLEESLLVDESVIQIITIITFFGYNEENMDKYMINFFGNRDWIIKKPEKIIPEYPLYLAITCKSKSHN